MGLEERLRATVRDFKQAEGTRKKVDDAAKKAQRQKSEPQISDEVRALRIPETLAVVEKAARKIFGNPPETAHFWDRPQTEFRRYKGEIDRVLYKDILIASARAGAQWSGSGNDFLSAHVPSLNPKWRLDVIAYKDYRGIELVSVGGIVHLPETQGDTFISGIINGETRPASKWTKQDIEEEILSAFRMKLSIPR